MLPKPTIIFSKRKTLCLQVTRDGDLLVRAPQKAPISYINKILTQKQSWIERKILEANTRNHIKTQTTLSSDQKKQLKLKARSTLVDKLNFWSSQMGLPYNKFKLSSAKTRWGSCSSKKNINLNWRLVLAPSEVVDYVVIHELAHLAHMNHSSHFWQLVANFNPQWKQHRAWLKINSNLIDI